MLTYLHLISFLKYAMDFCQLFLTVIFIIHLITSYGSYRPISLVR